MSPAMPPRMTGGTAALLAAALGLLPMSAQADGAALFAAHCSACHNEGGIGNPGIAPPLNRPGFWSGLGDRAPDYIAQVITHGLNGTIRAAGQDYVGLIMPPVAGLSDAEIAQTATWVLATLGGVDAPVSTDAVAAARAARIPAAELRQMRPAGE